jgi:poly-gamma-glutamate synthesis protein (capsule biosynthesis protein)
VPPELIAAAQQLAADQPLLFSWTDEQEADAMLGLGPGEPLATWVYSVAAPFATVSDSLNLEEVRAGWQTGTNSLGTMFVDGETATTLGAWWSLPGAAQPAEDDPAGALWNGRPSWTILPFHRLQPSLKVIAVDGVSPLKADFDPAIYPLALTIGVSGEEQVVQQLLSLWNGPRSNRDPGRLTRVAMTGVTALVRATAHRMETSGILYPGEEVAPVLQTADIAHVSNEVSFAPDCPFPNPIGGTTFCSRESYFALLQELGVDVVELTGNHLNDYGRENLLHTLGMYESAGMVWFGGGRDLANAAEPAIFTHNGNRIAFVGCNILGPNYAWAEAGLAGSRPCRPELAAQISQLRDEGYLVIATYQYHEYYQYPATPQQQADFAALAEAGAAAVSGSQGHHAQGFSFDHGAFIHYGLGNLFFDQMDMAGTRQTFVDTYVIYENRLLSVELWTGLIENYARPRLMTPDERAQLLQVVFQASGW